VEIAPGVKLAAWPYNGTIPGPVVHVKQGDTVHFVLTNRGTMPHSIDFHAAQVPPNLDYVDVKPDGTFTFDWNADYPGVFMYHCGSPLVIAHMASGMYGAVVVDPATPLPAAREYVIVQSEFYVGKDGKVDVDKVLKGQPDYTTFNGYANQYKDSPLPAKVGERVRLYVVNAGPSEFSAFHVIGTIFENAYADGNPANVQHGMQTVTIPPGGAYTVEFTIPNEGSYAFVTHSFADVNRGAVVPTGTVARSGKLTGSVLDVQPYPSTVDELAARYGLSGVAGRQLVRAVVVRLPGSAWPGATGTPLKFVLVLGSQRPADLLLHGGS